MPTLIKPKLNFSELIQLANTESVLKDIYQLRYSIYVEEMGKPYVNANHAEGMLSDDLDKHSTILYSYGLGFRSINGHPSLIAENFC